jgi:glutamate-ammonia-ligase adenylyltransferase
LPQALSGSEADQEMYRVNAGGSTLDGHFRALAASGGLADRVALVQARPVAGDAALGGRFSDNARAFIFGVPADRRALGTFWDEGSGANATGAFQVERLTQLFQLAHAAQHPTLKAAGTLAALDALASLGLVSEPIKRELSQAYVFLKTVEHRLQLVHDHQTGLGSSEDLDKQVMACRSRVAELSTSLIQPFTSGR